ncbi:WhiB family transcriptional regulator [Streptomyces violascens]|uniref:WhiB family transcriptional regulator n=1 Tax=Streptomyces violascens TaxID=67381 RepID=UPI0036A253CE
MSARPGWRTQAACGGADLEELFGEAAQQHHAKTVCGGCAVQLDAWPRHWTTGSSSAVQSAPTRTGQDGVEQ